MKQKDKINKYFTLYSKQEMQSCSRSSRRLICSTDKSDTQRSRRAASAFFSTHRKHTSRVRLHSADRELDWRAGWQRQTHTLSCPFNVKHERTVYREGREPPIGNNKQLSLREDEQCGKNAHFCVFLVELQKGQCGVLSS